MFTSSGRVQFLFLLLVKWWVLFARSEDFLSLTSFPSRRFMITWNYEKRDNGNKRWMWVNLQGLEGRAACRLQRV